MKKPHTGKMKIATLPNSVALASVVPRMPTCQLPRSAAKATPASTRNSASRRGGAARVPGDRASQAATPSTGSASMIRQKAAATGPVSDRRTNIGPKASAALPTATAISAGPSPRGCGAARAGSVTWIGCIAAP